MKLWMLALLAFAIVLVSCTASSEDQITGQVVSSPGQQTSNSVEEQEPVVAVEAESVCTDECVQDGCNGFKFVKCEEQSDGCMAKTDLVLIKGQCGVECLSDNDCGSNQECNDYECKNLGPAVVKQSVEDLRQQAKQGEVTRTVSEITLALKGIKYEVKDKDYAIITGIDFGIVNEGSESINPEMVVYLWDDNDPFEQKILERASVDVDGFGLAQNEFFVKSATVRIPFNDINLTKHLKLAATDSYGRQTYVSVEYDLDIK